MKNWQYLLLKLSEECNEVGQMAAKNMQFGMEEKQNAESPSNKERLHAELNDLIASIEMLNEEANLEFVPNREAIDRKKAKVKHYRGYSQTLNTVEQGE